jgi:hypothetical protein
MEKGPGSDQVKNLSMTAAAAAEQARCGTGVMAESLSGFRGRLAVSAAYAFNHAARPSDTRELEDVLCEAREDEVLEAARRGLVRGSSPIVDLRAAGTFFAIALIALASLVSITYVTVAAASAIAASK